MLCRSTDGQFLEYSASYVRSLNITVFAVGVGDAQIDELKVIGLLLCTSSFSHKFFAAILTVALMKLSERWPSTFL